MGYGLYYNQIMHLIKQNFLFQKNMTLCIQIQNLTEIHYATPIFCVFYS